MSRKKLISLVATILSFESDGKQNDFFSGTTGLPKAAVIKHSRFYFYCAGMHSLFNLGSIKDPIFYDPLPLYHSAGGIVGIGLMMVFGVTVVIRKKFSVRNFWKDIITHNCNVSAKRIRTYIICHR